MNDSDLQVLLHRATADLVPPADLLAGARQRGVRRLRRRRLTAALTVVAVAGGVATGAQLLRGPGIDRTQTFAGADPFGPVVDHPTEGDLAGDAGYLARAVAAWSGSHDDSANAERGIFQDLRGDAWVAWAGSTPAGPAALVAQKAFLHEHDDLQLDGEGVTTLVGFVGVDEQGRTTVVGDAYPVPGSEPTTAWFVDPARTVLAALDEGSELGVGVGWTYSADGLVQRPTTPMRDVGGAWLATGLSVGDQDTVSVQTLPPCPSCHGLFISEFRLVANPPPVLSGGGTDHRLPWPSAPGLALDATGPCTAAEVERFTTRTGPGVGSGYTVLWNTTWSACGTLPDGRRLVLGERAVDADPSRLLALLDAKVLDLGEIDPSSPLPVRAELPGGWAVASYGATLRARTGAGPWSAVHADAALFPLAATEVEVTRDGRAVVVPLAG